MAFDPEDPTVVARAFQARPRPKPAATRRLGPPTPTRGPVPTPTPLAAPKPTNDGIEPGVEGAYGDESYV
jgi:hypothetical protein